MNNDQEKSQNFELLTAEEVAEILKLPPNTVRKMLRNGEILSGKIQGSWRIRRVDLEKFIEKSIAGEIPSTSKRGRPRSKPAIGRE